MAVVARDPGFSGLAGRRAAQRLFSKTEEESHNIEKTLFLRLFDDVWTFTGHGRASAASSTQGLKAINLRIFPFALSPSTTLRRALSKGERKNPTY